MWPSFLLCQGILQTFNKQKNMVLAQMSDTLNVDIEQGALKQTGKILTVSITHPVRKKHVHL